LCIVVHFQPVIKLLQKGVRVHQKRVILMQKNAKFFCAPSPDPSPVGRGTPGDGDTPSPPLTPLGASILTCPHSEILPTLL